ncbi:MAG: hypothetical protein K6A40_12695 [Solobacterium sp.]|nr:hypothetical protein [Solobacterium sp.]
MKTFLRKHGIDLAAGLLMTVIVLFPYLTKAFLPIEHDTFFHLSRIENLSKAIRDGSFLPAVYPYENGGYGYASPLFYSDVFLIVPALLHIAGLPLTFCYKFIVFVFTYASALTMMWLAFHITKKRSVSLLAACIYLFSNYRITDIYVRGALGECLAFAPLPLVILGMYMIMAEKDTEKWPVLTAGLSVLALCHNLTFLFGSVLCVIFFLVMVRSLNKDMFISLCKGVGCAFLLTSFYTIPMIEQLRSQKFIVGLYAASSDLGSAAMSFRQFFANKTIFGFSGHATPPESAMLVNVGLSATFLPLLYLFCKEKNRFMTAMVILGYIFLILPGTWTPWDHLTFLRVIQFPWRLSTPALLLLCVPAAYACCELFPKAVIPVFCLILSAECVWHVLPVYTRTFGMPSGMSWDEVLDGALCDPYYSAYYVRVELAGADYLPQNAPDFRGRDGSLRINGIPRPEIEMKKYSTRLLFELDEADCAVSLPITWYKGYLITRTYEGKTEILKAMPDTEAMVSFYSAGPGTYVCMYQDTGVRTAFMNVTWITAVLLILLAADRRNGGKIIARIRKNLPF